MMRDAITLARREAAARGYRLAHEPGCALRSTDAPASACHCDSMAFVLAVSFSMASEREAAQSVAAFAREINQLLFYGYA